MYRYGGLKGPTWIGLLVASFILFANLAHPHCALCVLTAYITWMRLLPSLLCRESFGYFRSYLKFCGCASINKVLDTTANPWIL